MDNERIHEEEKIQLSKIGIRFVDLTPERFEDIITIYSNIAGGRYADYYRSDPQLFKSRLAMQYATLQQKFSPDNPYGLERHYGMVLGSKLNDHSKLEFFERSPDDILQQELKQTAVIKMSFYGNGQEDNAESELTKEVNTAITAYLQEKGLAISLK